MGQIVGLVVIRVDGLEFSNITRISDNRAIRFHLFLILLSTNGIERDKFCFGSYHEFTLPSLTSRFI